MRTQMGREQTHRKSWQEWGQTGKAWGYRQSLLAWGCCYGARAVPSCLSYRCHLASDNDQRECPLRAEDPAAQPTA